MQPYVPASLPLANLDLMRLLPKIGPANAALARYDGLLQSVVNPAVMLSPLTQREAVLSSKIEGTQATVDEVLEFEAGMNFDAEKTKDIQEVVNYRNTLMLATGEVAHRPISLGLLRQMHAVLMNGVRGVNKTPGEFRREQNWSGWIAFFLEAVTQQALNNTGRVRAMMTLYVDMKRRITELTRSQHAMAVLDALFDRPIFQSGDFVQRTGIPKQSALPFLRTLRDAGVLQVLRESSGRRSAVPAFRDLLNCAEGREIL